MENIPSGTSLQTQAALNPQDRFLETASPGSHVCERCLLLPQNQGSQPWEEPLLGPPCCRLAGLGAELTTAPGVELHVGSTSSPTSPFATET